MRRLLLLILCAALLTACNLDQGGEPVVCHSDRSADRHAAAHVYADSHAWPDADSCRTANRAAAG
jgi:hypothetical protein